MSAAIGHRPGHFRFALLAGITAGTALAVFATINGLHFALPGLPGPLDTLTGALAEWLIAVAAVTAAVELLRRHHRALAGGAWRRARARGEGLTGRLAAWAGPRWQRRHAPASEAATAAVQASPAAAPAPVTIPVAAPAPAVTSRNGDTPMTTPTTAPQAAAPRGRAANLPAPSALWRAVAAAAADFVPESEAEAAEWLRGQAAGLLLYAEGLMGAHANAVDGVGVDPVALRALHDAADTVAEAGGTIGDGANDLLAYFAEVREFVQAGKQMTHKGRWITGEGD